MPARERLSAAQITAKLGGLPRWKRAGDSIERTWRFETFIEAVAFINRVFALAEDADHHPDLLNSWTKVRVRFTTHDVGGLTDRDFAMAAKVDKVG
ncbi:MAG TPA: 4a-hydroxytetrahydrobiopterin dehydratase [Thermoplasmata archaeon]|nr:4a-hydroxytetrahydrobiopterin dehydratase [Thermoplasmata archaeon]